MTKLPLSLKARALNYLAQREHSRQELARKLARHAREDDDIDALLDSLEAAKLLSEPRFAESLVHRRAARYGNHRILSELQSHGIGGEALDAIEAGLKQDETVRAREIWRKKFGSLPEDAKERARQARFLLQRGFSPATIKAVLNYDIDDGE
ncbi:recombination regulator RecX [Noviherbaspirillum massiliense]|uniref:recombination regulator RecX n=1 Tax=Noviherbaspirillum massiliense TaxID=1465823 RepID=UPI0004749199|nr:recombination regulator RecX [Noviherbaspirillum massiliense]